MTKALLIKGSGLGFRTSGLRPIKGEPGWLYAEISKGPHDRRIEW